MVHLLRPCLGVFAVLTLVTGVAYPMLVTTVAQLVFPARATGNVLERDGRVVGSTLLGQPFSSPGYFWGRPSATVLHPYNGAASSGTHLAPTNPALAGAVTERLRALRAADPDNETLMRWLSEVLSAAGRADEGIEVTRSLLAAAREDEDRMVQLYLLQATYTRARRYDEAVVTATGKVPTINIAAARWAASRPTRSRNFSLIQPPVVVG